MEYTFLSSVDYSNQLLNLTQWTLYLEDLIKKKKRKKKTVFLQWDFISSTVMPFKMI